MTVSAAVVAATVTADKVAAIVAVSATSAAVQVLVLLPKWRRQTTGAWSACAKHQAPMQVVCQV